MFLTGRLIPLSSVFPSDPSSVKFPFHVHTQHPPPTSSKVSLTRSKVIIRNLIRVNETSIGDNTGKSRPLIGSRCSIYRRAFLNIRLLEFQMIPPNERIGPTTTAIQLLLLFRSRDEERLAWNIRGGRASWPRRRLDVVLHEFVRTPYIIHRRHELSNPSRGRTPSPRGCLDRT